MATKDKFDTEHFSNVLIRENDVYQAAALLMQDKDEAANAINTLLDLASAEAIEKGMSREKALLWFAAKTKLDGHPEYSTVMELFSMSFDHINGLNEAATCGKYAKEAVESNISLNYAITAYEKSVQESSNRKDLLDAFLMIFSKLTLRNSIV